MGWNGSGRVSTTRKTEPRKSAALAKPSYLRGILAGLAVAVVAGLVVYFVMGRDEHPQRAEESGKQDRKIAQKKPHLPSKTNRVARAEAAKPVPRIRVKPGPGNTGYSHIDYGPIQTNKPIKARQWIADRCFPCTTDRKIAGFLLMTPGDSVIGEYENYYKNFNKQFLRSLETPIIIEETDTAEEKELKEAVRDMRKELKDRLDAGEDLEKTMKDTWYQMKELAAYKEDLEKQVKQIFKEKRGKLSDQDMADLINAANEMLDSRGVSRLAMPSFLSRRLKMQQNLTTEAEQGEQK